MSIHITEKGSITATQGSGNKIVTWHGVDLQIREPGRDWRPGPRPVRRTDRYPATRHTPWGSPWRQRPLDVIERTYPDMRPAALERSMTRRADGSICLLLELMPLAVGWDAAGTPTGFLGNPNGPGKLLVWLISIDGARTWEVEPALEPRTFFNRANVERAPGPSRPGSGRLSSTTTDRRGKKKMR